MMFKSTPPKIRISKRRQTKTAQEILDMLKKFLEEESAEPVEYLCGVWEQQKRGVTYAELRRAAKLGAIDTKWLRQWSEDYNRVVVERLEPVWRKALASGASSNPLLRSSRLSWDSQSQRITQWVLERGGIFADGCTKGQREAIQALLEYQLTEKLPIDHFCQAVMPCIGLTQRQAKSTMILYHRTKKDLVKDGLKTEAAHKKALSIAQKYAEQQHQRRALTIAQTEMAAAWNYGAEEAIKQAQEQRLIGHVVRRWCTSGDDRVCETCAALDGTEVEMDSRFNATTKTGSILSVEYPPLHSMCGCAVQYLEVNDNV